MLNISNKKDESDLIHRFVTQVTRSELTSEKTGNNRQKLERIERS
jgi:hypothetical protein